jgi:predicted DNA binding CopG/RHH family protein
MENQEKIDAAIKTLNKKNALPMQSSQLVRELASETDLSVSTIYRYRHIWKRYAYKPRTSLDETLEAAKTDERFLISIRMPGELLKWLKDEAQRRHVGYQSFLISLLTWAKGSTLLSTDEEDYAGLNDKETGAV